MLTAVVTVEDKTNLNIVGHLCRRHIEVNDISAFLVLCKLAKLDNLGIGGNNALKDGVVSYNDGCVRELCLDILVKRTVEVEADVARKADVCLLEVTVCVGNGGDTARNLLSRGVDFFNFCREDRGIGTDGAETCKGFIDLCLMEFGSTEFIRGSCGAKVVECFGNITKVCNRGTGDLLDSCGRPPANVSRTLVMIVNEGNSDTVRNHASKVKVGTVGCRVIKRDSVAHNNPRVINSDLYRGIVTSVLSAAASPLVDREDVEGGIVLKVNGKSISRADLISVCIGNLVTVCGISVLGCGAVNDIGLDNAVKREIKRMVYIYGAVNAEIFGGNAEKNIAVFVDALFSHFLCGVILLRSKFGSGKLYFKQGKRFINGVLFCNNTNFRRVCTTEVKGKVGINSMRSVYILHTAYIVNGFPDAVYQKHNLDFITRKNVIRGVEIVDTELVKVQGLINLEGCVNCNNLRRIRNSEGRKSSDLHAVNLRPDLSAVGKG